MIYLKLFLGFLRVGCFAFGGAYGAIPLIRDVVLSNGWMSEDSFAYMIAVSESTPGPIMVNMATYVGSRQAGVLGALTATLAVIIPSFFIILIISKAMDKWLKNKQFQLVLRGLKPCIIGIILATGIYMIFRNCIPAGAGFDLKAAGLSALLALLMFFPEKRKGEKFKKKKISGILLILIAGVLGIALQM